MNRVMPLRAVYLFGSHARGDAGPESDVGQHAQGGDVVVVFSNGGFGGLHEKLLERLGRK